MSATAMKVVYESSAFELREGPNLIGRKDADITIPVGSLSKEHARIIRAGSRLEIEDLGSKNGTLVNDQPVQGRMSLEPGDVIVLGGKVELRIVSEGGAPAAAPTKSAGRIPLDDSKRSADVPPRREPAPPPAAGAPPAPKVRFTIVGGDGKGKTVDVSADRQFTLGTKEENSLPLKGEGISRYHAEVVFEKGVWLLKDLGSRNGSFVRDRKVDLHELAPGDVVQIGSVLLRFDQDAAKATADGRALVELVKSDPKAALKNPHIQRALALVLVAGIALVWVVKNQKPKEDDGGGGGGAGPTPAEVQRLTHEAIGQLQKEEAVKANDIIQKALRAQGYHASNTLTLLAVVAKKWGDHRSPISFEWKGAVEAIDAVVHQAPPTELDPDCVAWLQKSRAECQTEIPNSDLRTQADTLMTKGQTAMRTGNKKEGAELLRDAREAFEKMPPTSVFAAVARERAEQIRHQLLEHWKREGDEAKKPPRPRWDKAIALYGEARRYAANFDERRAIDEQSGVCELNLRDEKTLIEVVKIVQSSDEPSYAHARDLLDSIAPTSFCFKDAQKYVNWFKADGLARQAISAYNGGQIDNAQRLMTDALGLPNLEPPVVQSGKNMLERWAKVAACWEKGYAAEQKHDLATAKELFKTIVDLETNVENFYRKHADTELQLLVSREQEELDGALKEGVTLLDQGKFVDAYEKFCWVLERAPNPGPPRNEIEDAVARIAHEKNLYGTAKRYFEQNKKEKFPLVRDILQLLARFLPEKDPDQKAAQELLPKVKG